MKDFVPYQEAIELKQLGFDEPCFATYNTDKKVSRNPSHNIEDLPIEGQPYYWNNSKIHKDTVTAPLYQQAFRWFREKSFICHVTNDLSDNLHDEIYVYVMTKGYGDLIDRSEEYRTYEEAELACLQKLIELVKK